MTSVTRAQAILSESVIEEKAIASKGKVSRNLQLDVLRGIAVLLVVGRHLTLPFPSGVLHSPAIMWYQVGWVGVDLFFVLSGFLIGGLLIGELNSHGSIKIGRFLVRRGLKIYPPYIVFLAYIIVMSVIKGVNRPEGGWGSLREVLATHWPNFLFIQNYVGTNPEGHTWTLAVEEHFYLVMPFLLSILAARRCLWVLLPMALAAILFCLTLRTSMAVYSPGGEPVFGETHLRFDALFFGVGIRTVAYLFPALFARLGKRPWLLLAAGFLFWFPVFFLNWPPFFVKQIGLTFTLLGAGCLMVGAFHLSGHHFGRLVRPVKLAARVIGWIGVYSYSIYLWHVTATRIIEQRLGFSIRATFGATDMAWAATVLLILGAVITLGVVAAIAVEVPILRLRDLFWPSRSNAAAIPVRRQVQ